MPLPLLMMPHSGCVLLTSLSVFASRLDDPDLARDLANAAAQNPATTWCVTVTDEQGHAIGHGCARPGPRGHREKRGKPGPRDGRDPPRRTRDGPGFAFTATGWHGPPDDGYGTWQLHTGTPGQPDLTVTLDPIPASDCDHRFEAKGHDPGVKLRHLTQIRNATCTGPGCRRPATQCDFEHNTPQGSPLERSRRPKTTRCCGRGSRPSQDLVATPVKWRPPTPLMKQGPVVPVQRRPKVPQRP